MASMPARWATHFSPRAVLQSLMFPLYRLFVCGDSGDAFADDEGMDMIGAFVRAHGFEIAEVAHYGIFGGDAVGAEEVARLTGAIGGGGDVGALEHGDMRGFETAGVFEARALDGEELRLGDGGDHGRELLLHELVGGERFVIELRAGNGVGTRGFVAIHGGADDAPADAIARLRETSERGLQSFGFGEGGGGGNAAIGEREAGGDGGAHRPLVMNGGGGEAGRAVMD